MSTTIRPHFSITSSVSTILTPTPTPTPTPLPLTILLQPKLDSTEDFFPFHDLVKLKSQTNVAFSNLIQEGIQGQPEVNLYQSGCRISDDTSDCTTACHDATLFYGSLDTFYNCAALSSIAYWAEQGRYNIEPQAERNASSIMGSGSLVTFNGRPVLQSFVSCAQDSCANDHLSRNCNESVQRLTRDTPSEEIFNTIDDFCPSLSAEINPDIFGPGVLISYALQVCFSTTLYLLVKVFTLYVNYTEKQKKKQRKSNRQFTLKRSLTRIESMIWKDSGALSRTSVAIATTLVEFQEAQCWFVFALQIASILAIAVNSQEGTFWGEIVINGAFAFHVSQNGVLPMFLIQICLHNEGIRNWHTFLGFFMEYILAIVATTQKISFKDSFDIFQGQASIPSCGNNPSPRTYCAATTGADGLDLSFFPHPLFYKLVFLVLDSIAIIVLVVDQFSWTLRRHRKTMHIQLGRYRVGRFPESRFKPHWIKLSRWFWHFLEFTYLLVNILYLVSLVNIIKPKSFQANRWSYGQIIAMTVWGPVIVKLFDLILSGPPKNGERLNAGPPRLRIDNIINHRQGTCADDDMEADGYVPHIEESAKIASPRSTDGIEISSRVETAVDEDAEGGLHIQNIRRQ